MRYLLLILLLASPVWAVDCWNVDDADADTFFFCDRYPADGATSVDSLVTIWWYVPSGPGLNLDDRSILCVIAGDTARGLVYPTWRDTYDVIIESDDSMHVHRDKAFDSYFQIVAKIRVDGRWDSVTFRTKGVLKPFNVGANHQFFTGTESTGEATLSFARPYGSSVFGIDGDNAQFTVTTPSTVYATERTRQIVYYTLDDIPRGASRWRFYCVSSEADTSDTLGLPFRYTQVVDGRSRGVISR